MRTHFSFLSPIDKTRFGATTPGKRGPGSDDNEGILCITPNSSITGTSPPDCLMSYPGHLLSGGLTPRKRSSRCNLQPQITGLSGSEFDLTRNLRLANSTTRVQILDYTDLISHIVNNLNKGMHLSIDK